MYLNRGTLTFDHKFNESIAVHNIFRKSSSTDVGVSLIDDVQIVPWFKVIAGARFDNFDAEITNFSPAGAQRSRFTSSDQLWSDTTYFDQVHPAR